MGQVVVELCDLRRVGALLWAVCRRGATLAEQRIAHIRGDRQAHLAEYRGDIAQVNARQLPQRSAATGQVRAVGVVEARTQRCQEAAATIGRRRTAQTKNDIPHAQPDSGCQHLPGSEG